MISTIFGRRCIERRGWGQLSCTLLHASLSSFTRLSVVSVGGGEAGEWSGGGLCGNWTGASGFEGCFFTFVPLVRCNFVCSLLNFKFVRLNRFEQFMSNFWFVQAERLYCVCVYWYCVLPCTLYRVPWAVYRELHVYCLVISGSRERALCELGVKGHV